MRYLLGPELFWLLLYTLALGLNKANTPPSEAIDNFIDTCWFWIPMISLMVFALWWIPVVEKEWLLLRVWIFGLLGGHLVCQNVAQAYSKQGPGSGMVYTVSLIFLVIALIIGSIFIKLKF